MYSVWHAVLILGGAVTIATGYPQVGEGFLLRAIRERPPADSGTSLLIAGRRLPIELPPHIAAMAAKPEKLPDEEAKPAKRPTGSIALPAARPQRPVHKVKPEELPALPPVPAEATGKSPVEISGGEEVKPEDPEPDVPEPEGDLQPPKLMNIIIVPELKCEEGFSLDPDGNCREEW